MGENKKKKGKNNHDLIIIELETPIKWINEFPELELTITDLPSIKTWLRRHCSANEATKQTIGTQPFKLLARACIQIWVESTSKDCRKAEERLNWLRRLGDNYSAEFSAMKIDPESFNYISNAMKLCVQDLHTRNCESNNGCGFKGNLSDFSTPDFQLLSKPSLRTVRCLQRVKLLFYSGLYFPLSTQERLATKVLIRKKSKKPMDEFAISSELVHQYVRILRRIRHQRRNETLGVKAVMPSTEEITWINKALEMDSNNYKIKTTLYELLYDFVQIKTRIITWKPFKTCGLEFTTCKQIVIFLDMEIRKLLPQHSGSIRLNNLATKFNICKLYREVFPDKESQFGNRNVDRSLRLNSDSSSANCIIGQREIHYGNYDRAMHHFKTAMETKPLSPKYTLTYLRALVASLDVEKCVVMRRAMVTRIMETIQNKILFGILHKWSAWNIRHMQFLTGLMKWIFDGTFTEWLRYVGDSKFLEQFNYLSPFGTKILMLPTEGSVANIDALVKHCTKLEHSRDTGLSEYDFITSLRKFLCRRFRQQDQTSTCDVYNDRFGQKDQKSRGPLHHPTCDVYNEQYSKTLCPVSKIIKIKGEAEIELSPIDWARLQEQKLIAEIDQAKLIEKQAWYKNKIMPTSQHQIPSESSRVIDPTLKPHGQNFKYDRRQKSNLNVVTSKVKRGVKFVKKERQKKTPETTSDRISKREKNRTDFDFSIAN